MLYLEACPIISQTFAFPVVPSSIPSNREVLLVVHLWAKDGLTRAHDGLCFERTIGNNESSDAENDKMVARN
jgi:hypothetical protein